jgi:ABC-type bacteriocin/lantibiotic exporter with double-glycine peptidase domain
VQGVHEVRQSSAHDCGIAALSMVLQRWGAPTSSPAELIRDLSLDGGGRSGGAADSDEGVAAGTLRDLARRRGLRAFLIGARIEDLSHELGGGRPVLVGLRQRYTDRTLSHYEVVVGINSRTRRLLLFDPGHGPREDGFDGFSAEWNPTGGLAIVVTGWSSPQSSPPFAAWGGGP